MARVGRERPVMEREGKAKSRSGTIKTQVFVYDDVVMAGRLYSYRNGYGGNNNSDHHHHHHQ